MKESNPGGDEPVVVVAQAVKPRGLKGELVAELLTDFPDRFAVISSLIAVSPSGERRLMELEGYWFHQDRVVLKLAEVTSVEAAKELVGYQFAVPESERVVLDEGSFYDWELEGCLVETIDGAQIGKVGEVLRLGSEIDMLAVDNAGGQRRLIPMIESIVLQVDTAGKKIRIDPPEGLLEL